MKAFKAFLKPFEAPPRSVKIKFKLSFISIQLSEMHAAGGVNISTNVILRILRKLVQLKAIFRKVSR